VRERERGGIRDSQTERQRGGEEGIASANGGRGDALECGHGHAMECLLPEEVEEKEQCHLCVRERRYRACVCVHAYIYNMYLCNNDYI